MTSNERFEMQDRVREHSPSNINEEIDRAIEERVRFYAGMQPDIISLRLKRLDEEWDMERYLQVMSSINGLTGVTLGVTVNRKWLLLSVVTMGFLMQHSIQGWCPPLEAFRRLGVRTRNEIEREKVALQALRGDFDEVAPAGTNEARADAALRAAGKGRPD
jgi:hypothetical protein